MATRKIKFRYRYEQTCPGLEGSQIITRIYTLDEIAEWAKPWPNLEKILSRDEYTGLKDKNDKEIYEGDIVRFTIPEDERLKTTSKIVWNDSGFYQQRIDNDRIMFIGGYEGVLEVIGNIYENPELLK